jgi:hypothetical protein
MPYNRAMSAPAAARRIDTSRAALIVCGACRRAVVDLLCMRRRT